MDIFQEWNALELLKVIDDVIVNSEMSFHAIALMREFYRKSKRGWINCDLSSARHCSDPRFLM